MEKPNWAILLFKACYNFDGICTRYIREFQEVLYTPCFPLQYVLLHPASLSHKWQMDEDKSCRNTWRLLGKDAKFRQWLTLPHHVHDILLLRLRLL